MEDSLSKTSGTIFSVLRLSNLTRNYTAVKETSYTRIILFFSLSYTVFCNSWGKENIKVIGCEFFFPLVKTNLNVTQKGKKK